MDKRTLLSGCTTPICGAKLKTLRCESYDATVCYYRCLKKLKKTKQEEMELPLDDVFKNYKKNQIEFRRRHREDIREKELKQIKRKKK